MSKWRPWQQMIFLGYLLLLNLIIFGTLAFLIFTSSRGNQSTLAAVPLANAQIIYSTVTEVVPAASSTPIPSLDIPPAPLPQPVNAVTTAQYTALTEGSRSQSWTATPSSTATPEPTFTPPLASPTSANTSTPTQTATNTPRPTVTPLPTATSTPTLVPTTKPTYTPQPSATPTYGPTNTPQPTITPTRQSTNTPQPTPTSTPRLTQTSAQTLLNPTRLPTTIITASRTPTLQPTITPTRQDSPTAAATITIKLTHTPAPPPTPLVVAAALKNNNNTSSEPLSPRPVQPDLSVANTVDLVDAVALTNASIALSWMPTDKTGVYRIYSDMGSGYGVYIHKADVSEAAFVDKTLRPDMRYSYRVTRLQGKQEIVLAQTNAATFGSQSLNATLLGQRPPITTPIAPAPTALPADAVLLGLLSDSSFIDEFNTLNIVGEVRNDSNLDVGQADIAITFYDTAGAAIGTANGGTILDVIPPGEISPFLITLSRPAGMVSYSLRAVARPATPKLTPQLSVIQMKRFEDDAGFFRVQGVVKNIGSITAQRAKVTAIIYGRGGGVINVGFTYLTPPTLAPGERASYEVIFTYFPKYVSQKVIPFEE